MKKLLFLWDTGATCTTMPKDALINELGYTEKHISEKKVLLPDGEKPLMADGKRADVYLLPITRMNIGGHEIQPDYIMTSDTITTLRLLLGFNILGYFKFTFDLDAVDADALYGRMFYEFRQSRMKPYTKMGETFAYKMDDEG
jgi:hypothetical protein